MDINGSVALVTGANRGLGLAFARELLAQGAAKVYAGARDPQSVPEIDGLVPVRLDVTDPSTIATAAAELTDVTIVINNAGIITGGLPTTLDLDGARAELEVNYLGTLAVAQAFAPVLAANGGGALANMLSALSWVSFPLSSGYSASKAAAWSITNGLRVTLRSQGTLVTAIHAGYIDTDMTAALDVPKVSAESVAKAAIDGLAAGAEEVLADDVSKQVKSLLSDLSPVYADVQARFDAAAAAATAA